MITFLGPIDLKITVKKVVSRTEELLIGAAEVCATVVCGAVVCVGVLIMSARRNTPRHVTYARRGAEVSTHRSLPEVEQKHRQSN
jgi:hypothetical protein